MQGRLEENLKDELEEYDKSAEAYSITRMQSDGGAENVDMAEVYARIAKRLAGEIHSAGNFESWSIIAVF